MTGPSVHDDAGAPPVRWLHCRRYDGCLEVAVSLGWPSWCCTGCTGYEVIDAVQERSDVLALLTLLGEVRMPLGKRRRTEP